MGTLLDGIGDGLRLITSGDHDTVVLTLHTLRAGLIATALAAAVGVPLGVALGLGRFRGRRGLLGLVNAGIRLPPVALGQVLWLLMWPSSRWGGGPLASLHWIYTVQAVVLAQTLLALPIVAALVAAAVSALPHGLLDQARAFGASAPRRGLLAAREARIGILAAIVTAMGTAFASVGAIAIVGGSNVDGTLATAALVAWGSGGQDARAVAYGTVLLGVFLVLAAALTTAQQRRGAGWLVGRTS